jgi:putative ABC transport system ATP-binding protein
MAVADDISSPFGVAGLEAPVVALGGVEKTYRTGRVEYQALRGVDLGVESGEMVSIVGPSGSGKSTLLNVLTGIDRPTAGSVVVAGRDLVPMSEDELAVWRGENVGIVFQFFQLIPTLTALENTVLPLDFARQGPLRERRDRARERLDLVGLGDRVDHFPSELSGGEQQRVAIARALVVEPRLIVADEPTGNLDSETAEAMLDVLHDVNRAGTTIVYVTHDRALSERAGRVVHLRDGRIDGAS